MPDDGRLDSSMTTIVYPLLALTATRSAALAATVSFATLREVLSRS
jgi:hypothetical protein